VAIYLITLQAIAFHMVIVLHRIQGVKEN